MGEEAEKFIKAYDSAKKLIQQTQELLDHGDRLTLIRDNIAQIKSLCYDMDALLSSCSDSIPSPRSWQSKVNLVFDEVSSMYSRLQQLLANNYNSTMEQLIDEEASLKKLQKLPGASNFDDTYVHVDNVDNVEELHPSVCEEITVRIATYYMFLLGLFQLLRVLLRIFGF